jgi:hypothetical protein
MLFVAWFFFFVPVSNALQPVSWRLSRPSVLTAVGLPATALLLWWLWRRRPRLERLGQFMALSGWCMLAMSSVTILRSEASETRYAARSALVRDLGRPIPSGTARHADRDIYLIVMDEYANGEVLRERFGFDNGPFEDSLRALGFTIPPAVRSNYAQTNLSLASMLNFEHLTRLTQDFGQASENTSVLEYLIENNRTIRFLQARGYRFDFFPSPWWASTLSNQHADLQFKAWNGFSLDRELSRSDLRLVFRETTLLRFAMPWIRSTRDHGLNSFEGLRSLPADSVRPRFVFAHFLMPHGPFLVDAECRLLTPPPPPERMWRDQRGYVDKLRCANAQLLRVLPALIARSRTPPIIIVQGDHGSALANQVNRASVAELTPDELRERFGAFGAYYLPAGGDRGLGDVVTPVNVLRHVLGYYFDAELPRLPDDQYFSVYGRPYDFRRVSGLLTARDSTN